MWYACLVHSIDGTLEPGEVTWLVQHHIKHLSLINLHTINMRSVSPNPGIKPSIDTTQDVLLSIQ